MTNSPARRPAGPGRPRRRCARHSPAPGSRASPPGPRPAGWRCRNGAPRWSRWIRRSRRPSAASTPRTPRPAAARRPTPPSAGWRGRPRAPPRSPRAASHRASAPRNRRSGGTPRSPPACSPPSAGPPDRPPSPGPEREGDRVAEPVGKEHLGRREQHVVGRDPGHRLGVEHRGVDLVLVLVDRRLGIAGRARGVEPEAVAPGRGRLGRAPGLGGGEQRLVGEPAGRVRIDADPVPHRRPRLGERRLHLGEHVGMGQHRAGARIPQHVGVVRRPQEVVDRDRHRADPRRAEEAIVEAGPVLAEQHHPVARPDPEHPERVGRPVHPLGDRGVAPGGAMRDQRRLVAPPRLQVAVEKGHRDVEGPGEFDPPRRGGAVDGDAVIAHAPPGPDHSEPGREAASRAVPRYGA